MAESVVVVGAGAVGGYFAAHLAAAGAKVTCCVRRPFVDLVVHRADGSSLTVQPAVATDPSLVGRADVVLVAVKAHQLGAAAPFVAAATGTHSVVAVAQNGVEQVERVAPLVGDGTEVVPAVVYCGVEQLEPGVIRHRSNGFLRVPAGAAGQRIADVLEGTGAPAHLVEDITSALWLKLCGNVAANGPTALTGRRVDVFVEPLVAHLARDLVGEAAAVAVAEGAEVPDDLADAIVEFLAGPPHDRGTSMLYDRLAGRPLEWDAIYGAVQRAGRRHGIPTPRTDVVTALLAGCSSADPPL